MKKIFYILILSFLFGIQVSFASVVGKSCGQINSNTVGCMECYEESVKVYGCNPYQASCVKEGMSGLSDTLTNTGTTQRVQWIDGIGPGVVQEYELQTTADWVIASDPIYEVPATFGPIYTAGNGDRYTIYSPGETKKWIQMKSGKFYRFEEARAGTDKTKPVFRVDYVPKSQAVTSTNPTVLAAAESHRQCVFYNPSFCGDGEIQSNKGEQCDDGNMNSGDGCSNSCQTEVVAVCNNLTVTPTSVTNGGSVTYTCSGTNATSYSIIAKKPDGTTLTSSTSAAGSIILPISPAGTYTISCYINGQVSTPAACEKTVTNTVVNEAVCTDLSVTPTSLINGGNVTYTCSGNNVSSYSVVFTKPDGTVFQSLTTASGSVTVPASPTGSYIAKCYVNGQTTTPAACQKTVSNNESICTGLTVTPPSVVNGGNVSYSCTGNNVSSYSVIFKKPDGTTLQSFTTPTGSVAIPATPLGTYSAQCFVNGQTTTPADCTKTVSNNTVITPTCDNLSVTTSGTTVNYSCTGSNVSSYSIHQNGSQISTSPSGTLNVGYGTHTFTCYVNGSITSASCQKTVTINNPTTPAIQVVKDDNDNHDDFQLIQNGLVQFTIVVRNPGSEPLENVTLSDPSMPECDRNSTETQNMIINVGNRDYRLDPGESFSYLCTRPNVNQGTFPNNVNNICVSGRGTPSGTSVNSCDTSRVGFDTPNICQYIQVSQSGNQANVSCSPNGGYKLFVLQGQQVMNTYQNPNGQFNITLNDGTYKIVCLRDGEQTVQPNCQKTITVNPRQDYCTLESTVRYGGAPLHTELNCRSTNAYAQCAINVMKDGQPWRTINDCYASMVFTEKGIYDATCVIENVDTQNCNTRVQVDIMTFIPTGPFLPTIIFLAIGMAGYITYRRRKIV